MLKKSFILIVTIFIISCTGQKSLSKNDVVIIMDGFFEKVKQNDYNLVDPYYSETIFETTSREEWKEIYNKIHFVLGELISTELESWNIRTMLGTSGSGKYYTFVYNNKYENGIAKETINLFLPKSSNEVKIIGHNYASEAFLGLLK